MFGFILRKNGALTSREEKNPMDEAMDRISEKILDRSELKVTRKKMQTHVTPTLSFALE